MLTRPMSIMDKIKKKINTYIYFILFNNQTSKNVLFTKNKEINLLLRVTIGRGHYRLRRKRIYTISISSLLLLRHICPSRK